MSHFWESLSLCWIKIYLPVTATPRVILSCSVVTTFNIQGETWPVKMESSHDAREGFWGPCYTGQYLFNCGEVQKVSGEGSGASGEDGWVGVTAICRLVGNILTTGKAVLVCTNSIINPFYPSVHTEHVTPRGILIWTGLLTFWILLN